MSSLVRNLEDQYSCDGAYQLQDLTPNIFLIQFQSLTTASDGNTTLDILQTVGTSQVTVFVPVDTSLNNRVSMPSRGLFFSF